MKTPYVYIIQHIPSGRKYVGSQYSKKADPDKLLKVGGYHTSSKTVKRLIETDGVENFLILDIILEEELKIPFNNLQRVYEYETFLQELFEVNKSEDWLNIIINNKVNFNFPLLSPEVKERHLKICQSEENLKKIRDTHILKYSCMYSQTEKSKSDMRSYWENRGETPYSLCDKEKHREKMNSPELWEKIRKTLEDRYENGHQMRDAIVIQKCKESNLAKYGVENHSMTEYWIEKMKINNPMFIEENITAHRLAMIKLHSSDKHRNSLKNVEEVVCPHCGKVGKGMGAMYQWHFTRCKQNPDRVIFKRKPKRKFE